MVDSPKEKKFNLKIYENLRDFIQRDIDSFFDENNIKMSMSDCVSNILMKHYHDKYTDIAATSKPKLLVKPKPVKAKATTSAIGVETIQGIEINAEQKQILEIYLNGMAHKDLADKLNNAFGTTYTKKQVNSKLTNIRKKFNDTNIDINFKSWHNKNFN